MANVEVFADKQTDKQTGHKLRSMICICWVMTISQAEC